jgi:hypothetical protein
MVASAVSVWQSAESDQPQEDAVNLQSRIETLKDRHANLETRIHEEDGRPQPDADALVRLKIEKLHLKEELERLRTRTPEH